MVAYFPKPYRYRKPGSAAEADPQAPPALEPPEPAAALPPELALVQAGEPAEPAAVRARAAAGPVVVGLLLPEEEARPVRAAAVEPALVQEAALPERVGALLPVAVQTELTQAQARLAACCLVLSQNSLPQKQTDSHLPEH